MIRPDDIKKLVSAEAINFFVSPDRFSSSGLGTVAAIKFDIYNVVLSRADGGLLNVSARTDDPDSNALMFSVDVKTHKIMKLFVK